ncbi:Cupredoxin, partial [Lactarius vividus]
NSLVQHWHGIFQRGSNYADGGAFVNQCPIIPGGNFTYEFPTGEQAGTYWYHSHFRAQYCDGLRGPLVVYDPEDPHASRYDVDDEDTIITLADWCRVECEYESVVP